MELFRTSGVILDAHAYKMEGAPVGTARVWASSGTGSALTDESGRYSISGLEPGEYNVSVRDLQRFSAYSTTYTVRGSATFDIAYTAGSVRGRVLNASTNEPINGATVQLRPTSGSTESRMNMLGATSDSSGTFSIELVPAGSYSLTAGFEGFANQILETTIGNAGRDDLEIKLMRNDGVKLRIVDGRDGRQLNGTAVAFDQQGRVVHDGRMVRFFGGSSPEELTLQLSPGTYSVTVRWALEPVSETLSAREEHVLRQTLWGDGLQPVADRGWWNLAGAKAVWIPSHLEIRPCKGDHATG